MSIRQVALGPEGAYYIQWNDGSQAFSGKLPRSLRDQLISRYQDQPPVDFVALGPNHEWFMMFTHGKAVWGNACDEFNRAVESNMIRNIKRVVFGPRRTWFIKGSNGIHTILHEEAADDAKKFHKQGRKIEDLALGENGEYWMKFDDGTSSDNLTANVASVLNERSYTPTKVILCSNHWLVIDKLSTSWSVSAEFDEVMDLEKPLCFDPRSIRYTQDIISPVFQDSTSVHDTMRRLCTGALGVNDIACIRVAQDAYGNWWSLDNRRLWCFKTCDLTRIPAIQVQRNTNYWIKCSRLHGNGWNIKF